MSSTPLTYKNPLLDAFAINLKALEEEKKSSTDVDSVGRCILSDGSDLLVIEKIKNLISGSPLLVNIPTSYFNSTLLSLAVMKNRFKVVDFLIKQSACISAKDKFGWTPMVHAALVSERVQKLLIRNQGNIDYMTPTGVSFESLKELISEEIDNFSLKRLKIQKADESLVPSTKKGIEQLLNLKSYRSKSFYHLHHLRLLWNDFNAKSFVDPGYAKLANLACIKGLSKLAIKKDIVLQSIGVSRALGLFSDEPLQPCRFIGTYAGESVGESDKEFLKVIFGLQEMSPYQFGVIDAKDVGNECRMINDGPPNVAAIDVGHDTYFITIKDIPHGGELLFDYGSGDLPLRWGKYVIKNKPDVLRFFKQKFETIFSEDLAYSCLEPSERQNPEVVMARIASTAIPLYAFFTPQVLINLVTLKVQTVENLHKLKSLDYIQQGGVNDPESMVWINALLDYLEDFEKFCLKISPDALKIVQTEILRKEGHLNIFQTLYFMQKIEKYLPLQHPDQQADLVKASLEAFTEEASTYSFKGFDENMPLFRGVGFLKGDMSDHSVFNYNNDRFDYIEIDEYNTYKIKKDSALSVEEMVQIHLKHLFV